MSEMPETGSWEDNLPVPGRGSWKGQTTHSTGISGSAVSNPAGSGAQRHAAIEFH